MIYRADLVFCEFDQFCAHFPTVVYCLHCGEGVLMRICISGNDSNSVSDSDMSLTHIPR